MSSVLRNSVQQAIVKAKDHSESVALMVAAAYPGNIAILKTAFEWKSGLSVFVPHTGRLAAVNMKLWGPPLHIPRLAADGRLPNRQIHRFVDE